MTTYGDRRITRLAKSLRRSGIDPEVAGYIMKGGEATPKRAENAVVAAWMRGATERMDQLLEPETRYAVREGCACCLGGKRLKDAKAIAKAYDTLEERIRAIDGTRMCYFQNVTLQEDGTIRLGFFPDGWDHDSCHCLRDVEEPLSITYCYCCGGHVKHHMQVALGRTLAVEVASSALSRGGQLPCVLDLTIVE